MEEFNQLSNKIVALEYTLFFEVPTAWMNGYAFEADLAKFFEAYGMEARVIKMMEGMSSGRRILLISKKPSPPPTPAAPETKSTGKAPTVMLKELTDEYPNRRKVKRRRLGK